MDLKQMLTLNSDSTDPGILQRWRIQYICVFIWVQNIEALKKKSKMKERRSND